jgi:AcrR family transcriptional regulator
MPPQKGKADTGLRGRKKARRRQDILRVAGTLFNEKGFDATTMADIAEAAEISPPTVFNYFGSKDNILSALLFEGAARERVQHLAKPRSSGRPFAEIIGELLCEITENTMRIAGKRVWRYAESANIRRTNLEFQRQFIDTDLELMRLIRTYLRDYDLTLRTGGEPDHTFLARLFFDRWTARYFEFIKEDAMTLEDHFNDLRSDSRALVDLLFADSFALASPLRSAGQVR